MSYISKQTLKEDRLKKLANGVPELIKADEAVTLMDTSLNFKSGEHLSSRNESLMNESKIVGSQRDLLLKGQYESGFDVPLFENGKKSFREMVKSGKFDRSKIGLKGDTLMEDWQNVADALRIDTTLRKAANPTIRQNIYDITVNPNYTRLLKPTDLNPYFMYFDEVNGAGQSVKQGKNMEGQSVNIEMKIYGAGYTHDLIHELFDPTVDPARLNDSVALAYAAKRDDLAIEPIINGNYGTVGTAKWTAASAAGDNRQELLFNTMWDAVDGLGLRTDINDRLIEKSGLIVLANPYDADHISFVLNGGLPSDRNRKYNGIPAVSQVLAYDGEVITGPDKTITYAGVPQGTCFIIKPEARYWKIPVKRDLVAEFDANPNVATLSRGERAWWFVESIYNSVGIDKYVQKVTLPAW